MSNELYNVLARATDGLYEGAQTGACGVCVCGAIVRLPDKASYSHAICACLLYLLLLPDVIKSYCDPSPSPSGIAIGGDTFPGSTLSDHVLRYQNMPGIKMIVVRARKQRTAAAICTLRKATSPCSS